MLIFYRGGTNLRVGFVEVLGQETPPASLDAIQTEADAEAPDRVRRLLEKSWPIANHLKSDNSDSLFLWIGHCIAEVVRDGCSALQLSSKQTIPLGVTFSFPMVQHSLSEAILMSMGKGFAISADVKLGSRLLVGYSKAKTADLPDISVDAIANDSVATLISFIVKYNETPTRRAAMGLILGTGCNATIPLRLSQLHPSKRPENVTVLPGKHTEDAKVTINTEWSINGTVGPLREMGLITSWDEQLDAQNETPGFQPLEYMTAGRYLGELGRIMLIDYMTAHMDIPRESLPPKLLQRHSLTTTFLSHFKPFRSPELVASLEKEFPAADFVWTDDIAAALFPIAKAIEVRAAGIVAAATLALLTLAGEVPAEGSRFQEARLELGVGYTGGCISHFQDYLEDCQQFLDFLVQERFGPMTGLRVVLSPCHDGGITGAGILVASAASTKATRGGVEATWRRLFGLERLDRER